MPFLERGFLSTGGWRSPGLGRESYTEHSRRPVGPLASSALRRRLKIKACKKRSEDPGLTTLETLEAPGAWGGKVGGYVIWDRKAKGNIGVPNYTLKAKAGDKCWVMQPQVFNLFRLWALRGSLCLNFTSKPFHGCYWLTVWARLAEGCGEQPAAPLLVSSGTP